MPASSLGSFAEFEHGIIRQRVMAGLDWARARGSAPWATGAGSREGPAEAGRAAGGDIGIGRIYRELGVQQHGAADQAGDERGGGRMSARLGVRGAAPPGLFYSAKAGGGNRHSYCLR